MSEDELLRTDTGSLVDYYVAMYELPTVQRDGGREPTREKGKRTSDGWTSSIPVTIRYPVLLEEKLNNVVERQSGTYSGMEVRLEDNNLAITIQVSEGTPPENVESEVRRLEQIIQWKNDDVKKGNERLRKEIRDYIEGRKTALMKEGETVERLFEKVQIPIKQRQLDSPFTLEIRKKVIPTIRKADPLREITLDKAQVLEVIKTIKNAGNWMSRAPEVFSKLEEEHLRDILLAGLNMVFEGAATGETFSKRGKTDIYLPVFKGDILIAECKIWNGSEYYLAGMKQLFDYLTWRENYGIMITFSRNKNFTDVLEAAKNIATTYPTYNEGSFAGGKDYFMTRNRFPTDDKKTVEIHHLFFTLV